MRRFHDVFGLKAEIFEKLFGLIFFCCGGIDFGALDGEKTYLFFMLISPKEDIGSHLKILAKISHLIKDRFMVGLFKKAHSKKEILSMISNLEKSSK